MSTVQRAVCCLLFAVCASSIVACGDKNATILPPGYVARNATPSVAAPTGSATDSTKTAALFTLATDKAIGDKVGRFELREEGMLLHPGETMPTQVSFKLARKFHKLSLRAFIAKLPAEASGSDSGTVGIEFKLDGKTSGRRAIDRHSQFITTLNLENIESLTIVVDNGNGKAWFDWLMLGVVELH